MRYGVLGTGMVGNAIASRLVELGHEVCMGARRPDNEKALAWVAAAGEGAANGTFEDGATFGEVVFNCTSGAVTLDVLAAAGAVNLEGKVLVDLANALDFSHGMPPTLTVANTDSLAEQVQRAFPGVRVVKALNTVNASIMVRPDVLAGEHDLFMCGNDAEAKATVLGILGDFGWPRENVFDLGDITGARAMEMYLPLWIRLMGLLGRADFNIRVVR